MAAQSFKESGHLALKSQFTFVWQLVSHSRAAAFPLEKLDVFKTAMGAILAILTCKSDPDVGRH